MNCKVSSYIIGGRRKIFYSYPNNSEMIEEYDIKSHVLINRRLKQKSKLGEKEVIEIGEDFSDKSNDLLLSNNNNPKFVRQDTADSFCFRIRNLFNYTIDMFTIDIDDTGNMFVLRTTNKKYFKKFDIPDLQRLGLKLNKTNLSLDFKNNTLVIFYKKPNEILQRELQIKCELEKLNKKNFKEGDLECQIQ